MICEMARLGNHSTPINVISKVDRGQQRYTTALSARPLPDSQHGGEGLPINGDNGDGEKDQPNRWVRIKNMQPIRIGPAMIIGSTVRRMTICRSKTGCRSQHRGNHKQDRDKFGVKRVRLIP